MNILLEGKRPDGSDVWNIVCIYKASNDTGDSWIVRSKLLSDSGKLTVLTISTHSDRSSADKACKKYARRKEKNKGLKRVSLSGLPSHLEEWIEPDPDDILEPEDLIKLVERARKERYVYFSDISNLEGFFQLGVEYFGYITEDPNLIEVVDDLGVSYLCFLDRLSNVEDTERVEEAMGMRIA